MLRLEHRQMRRVRRWLFGVVLLVSGGTGSVLVAMPGAESVEPDRSGLLVSGTQRVRAQVPRSAPITAFSNQGYSLSLVEPESQAKGGKDGFAEIEVSVTLDPVIEKTRFQINSLASGQISELAQRLARRARYQEDAVALILGWQARNIEYRLDRSLDQGAVAVFARRTAYCTGMARLAVALLGAVGIESREVVGYALDGQRGPDGYHRWIEVFYPGQGWRFADPQATVDFVPATYIRLASESVPISPQTASTWAILEQGDNHLPITSDPQLPVGLERRYAGEPVKGARLRVLLGLTHISSSHEVPMLLGPEQTTQRTTAQMPGQDQAAQAKTKPISTAVAVLTGTSWVQSRTIDRPIVDFVDLAPGRYTLSIGEHREQITLDERDQVTIDLRSDK